MKLTRISWMHISIFTGIYTVLGCVIWIVSILSDSAKWCGVGVGAAKETGQRLPISDCTSILLALIDKLGALSLVLVASFALGFLTWAVIGLRANLSFKGPLGWSGDVYGSDAAQAADRVAGAAQDAADRVKEQGQ